MKQLFKALIVYSLIIGICLANVADAEDMPSLIPGYVTGTENRSVSIYYPSGNGEPASVNINLTLKEGSDILTAVLTEMFSGVYGTSLSAFTDADRFNCEFSNGIATVRFSLNSSALCDDREMLLLISSISNTLLALEDVNAVNILFGGAGTAVFELPTGAITEPIDSVTGAYIQAQTENNRFFLNGMPFSRDAVLYFPSSDGKWFLPEVHSIECVESEPVQAILKDLSHPRDDILSSSIVKPLPEFQSVLASDPVINTDSSGRKTVTLRFLPSIRSFMEFYDIPEWSLYGAIVLSLCSFIPGIDGVRIYIGEDAVTACEVKGQLTTFSEGILRRSDFDACIGETVRLFFADAYGQLNASAYSVPVSANRSAKDLLCTAIASVPYTSSLMSVFPASCGTNDILSVHVRDGIATVDISSALYCICQSFDDTAERLFVYSVVNTLCERSEIKAVKFTVEGNEIGILSRNIYAGSPLLPSSIETE